MNNTKNKSDLFPCFLVDISTSYIIISDIGLQAPLCLPLAVLQGCAWLTERPTGLGGDDPSLSDKLTQLVHYAEVTAK